MIFKNSHDSEFVREPVQGRWGATIRFSIISLWAIYLIIKYFYSCEIWLPMVAYALVSLVLLIIPTAFSRNVLARIFPVVVDTLFLSYVVHLFGSTTSQISVYYVLLLIGYHVTGVAPVRRAALALAITSYGAVILLEALEVVPRYTATNQHGALLPVSESISSFLKVAIAIGGSYLFLSVATRKIDKFIATEKQLREATRISQAQTQDLQKQIESAQRLESLGRLAGGVAHDFNNLLTGILTNSQFLKDALKGNERSLEDVEKIIFATRQASVLTSQLLTFGRKQVVRPRILNLNKIIMESHGAICGAIGPQIALNQQLNLDLGNLKADAALIKQVLLNLVVNARDAMPNGGTLTIQTENMEITQTNFKDFPDLSLGSHIQLVIADTGKGIAPEDIEKIFDPFFTTKHGEHATGLGLSSVYGVVRQANGHVDASSEPGKGTSIRILFPRVFESATVNTAPQPIISATTETILLVEDEEMVRSSVERILKRHNYNVLSAASGEEAMDVFAGSADHISLILTDVIMTGITGEALADHIHQTHPHLPVLFMSGYTEDAISNQGILKEGTAFIPKPFSSDELLVAVAQTLKRAGKNMEQSTGN
ncbi:MAG: response regulator [Deltaproteobacteria bacterium]|nr:response regulator [Deltaproteobacteria bacterium]